MEERVNSVVRRRAAQVEGESAVGMQRKFLARRNVRIVTSGVVLIVIWHVLARVVVHNPLFLPTPSEVLQIGIQVTATGELLTHIAASARHFLLGSAAGFVIGMLLGMIMATSKMMFDYLDWWVSAAYTAPLVAFTPLFIMWFGIGTVSKSVVVFLLVVFPVIINTMAGIRSVDRNLVDVAVSFGASRREVLWKVMVPWSVPFILSGARIGVGRGVVGVFVAELFAGAGKGVGWQIQSASQVFNMPLMFVDIIVLAVAGIALNALVQWVERRVAPWRPETSA